MANVSRINGFTPVKHISGAPYNGQFNLYEIVAGDGTTTHIGDLVKGDTGAGTEGYMTCVRFAASGQATSGVPIGVIVGFKNDPTNLNYPQYRAASTKRIAMVCDDPGMIYEVQDGAVTANLVSQTTIGLNTGVTCTIGVTTGSNSLMATGTTAPDTTATLPLRVMGIKRAPDNNDGAQTPLIYQKVYVMLNSHQFGSVGTTGV